MASGPLSGRTALVTGANHGIGAATAIALAELGADVAVTYLRGAGAAAADPTLPPAYGQARRQDASAVVRGAAERGVRAIAIEADLGDPTIPSHLFHAVEAALGPVAILVHNASGWRPDTFAPAPDGASTHLVTAATFDAQFHVDARGGALLMAELAERHRRRGATWGRIVSLTSGGPLGFPGEASYGAAKAALENYTLAAAAELAECGITANVVYPPVTDTGWITEQVRQFVATSPEHFHVAQPAEVAQVIAWLCTDAAGLVTGSVIRLR